MTIQEIIAGLAAKYGRVWPEAAIERCMELYVISEEELTQAQRKEYFALRRWLGETVEASIVFKQAEF